MILLYKTANDIITSEQSKKDVFSQKISLEKLRKGVKKKFGAKIEVITLGAKLIEVENFTILPRMIKKLTLSKLKTFFLKEGNKLKPKILI